MTGGAGFIGSNLCRTLVASDQVGNVVALDDLSTGSVDNLDGVPVDLVVGSILHVDDLVEVVDGAEVIVHLAARPSVPRSIADPERSHEVNATGTLRVLEAARSVGARVIVASSSSVYGANPTLPKHESMATLPMSPYAVSKLATEQYALAWQHSYGLSTLAFRFYNVFGPRQAAGHAYAAVVPAFVSAALRGEPLVVHGDGLQSRDFTDVATVCRVLTDAAVRGVTSPTPVNLAFGTRVTLLDLIGELEEIVGHPVERRHVESRTGDVRHSQADNASLRQLFPDVSPTPLTTALRATVDWMAGTGTV